MYGSGTSVASQSLLVIVGLINAVQTMLSRQTGKLSMLILTPGGTNAAIFASRWAYYLTVSNVSSERIHTGMFSRYIAATDHRCSESTTDLFNRSYIKVVLVEAIFLLQPSSSNYQSPTTSLLKPPTSTQKTITPIPKSNQPTMKSFTATLALASAATASSLLTRQDNGCILNTQTTDINVQSSIVQWNSDVVAVNQFLNVALGLSSQDLGTQASDALIFASDEPCQLATLSNDANTDGFATDAFTCAVGDLEAVFGDHVITNLKTIISDPADTAAVHAAVQDINFFRMFKFPSLDLYPAVFHSNS